MNALDLLRRERFMSLRGVKAARVILGRDPLHAGRREALLKALVFLRGFVVDRHFPRTESVLETWYELRGTPRQSSRLPGLKALHRLAASMLLAAEGQVECVEEGDRNLTESMEGLVEQLSHSFLADEDCFHAIEVEVESARETLLVELAAAAALDPELEPLYVALLEELEGAIR